MVGREVSHYRVLEKLGQGGMGVVYKALDTSLEREVALKFLPPTAGAGSGYARLIREAQTAARLNHPNICTIHEVGRSGDQPFIAMELVDGRPLSDIIAAGRLDLSSAVEIFKQVCAGVAVAHKHKIVHRDIKPSNILVSEDGNAKILDFGLARLSDLTVMTADGLVQGTVAYMSPEQARGEHVDHRTDIWSLGVMLYEMITGERPFRGEYEQAVIYGILNESPTPLRSRLDNAPEYLEVVLSKMLAKSPEERYQTIADLLAVFEAGTHVKGVPQASRHRRTKTILVASALLTGLVTAGIMLTRIRSNDGATTFRGIAVLPFENISGDSLQAYFSEGMTDVLIGELSKLSGLHKVIARESVQGFGDRATREIAEELGVSALVMGSTQKERGRVRISARLVRATDGSVMWANTYDRDYTDILRLESELALAISSAVQIELSDADKSRLSNRRPVDPAAYDAYLNGRFSLEQGELERAERSFLLALQRDSSYAPAYAGLSDYYSALPFYTDTAPRDAFPKAREAAYRALALDGDLPEAHLSVAYFRTYYDWDWQGAEREFLRTLELNPNYPTARHAFSRFLASQGRLDEAFDEIRRAQENDPLSLVIQANVGVLSYFARRYDDARRQLQKTIDIEPDFPVAHWGLGLVLERLGLYDDAVAELERVALPAGGSNSLASLAFVYARAGREQDARQLLRLLHERSEERYVSSYQLALVHAGLGEIDEAFQMLQGAYDERSTLLGYLKMDPRLDSIRTDPRFGELLRRIGLA